MASVRPWASTHLWEAASCAETSGPRLEELGSRSCRGLLGQDLVHQLSAALRPALRRALHGARPLLCRLVGVLLHRVLVALDARVLVVRAPLRVQGLLVRRGGAAQRHHRRRGRRVVARVHSAGDGNFLSRSCVRDLEPSLADDCLAACSADLDEERVCAGILDLRDEEEVDIVDSSHGEPWRRAEYQGFQRPGHEHGGGPGLLPCPG